MSQYEMQLAQCSMLHVHIRISQRMCFLHKNDQRYPRIVAAPLKNIFQFDVTSIVDQLLMKELIDSIEQTLKPINICLETPNLTNLNNLGIFFKEDNQFNIHTKIKSTEKNIKIIFQDCIQKLFKDCKKEKQIEKQFNSEIKIQKWHIKSAYEWFNEGLALDILNKFSESIECYSQVLNLQPTQKRAWYNKGSALMKQKRFLEAIDCFQQVINLNPNQQKALHNQGLALMNLQQFQEAIDCYQKAININPKYKEAWNNQGIALMNLQQFQAAIFCYQQAIYIDFQYKEAYNNIGVALMNLQQFEEAIINYQQAINIDVQYKEAWCNQGLTLINQKKFLEAINCCQQAITIDQKYTLAIKYKQLAEEQCVRLK